MKNFQRFNKIAMFLKLACDAASCKAAFKKYTLLKRFGRRKHKDEDKEIEELKLVHQQLLFNLSLHISLSHCPNFISMQTCLSQALQILSHLLFSASDVIDLNKDHHKQMII